MTGKWSARKHAPCLGHLILIVELGLLSENVYSGTGTLVLFMHDL